MPLNISEWPTKSEVCGILGLSLSQVNNLVKQKRLEVRLEKRAGRAPLGRVNPKDVEHEKELRTARETKPHVMPEGDLMREPELMLAPMKDRFLVRAEAAPLRFAFLNAHPPLWLRFDQAIAFTGLGESRLRELVEKGDIRTERGPRGAVVLSRADLETHAERG